MAEKKRINPFIIIFVGLIVLGVLYILLSGKKEKYTPVDSLPTILEENKTQDGDTQADTIRALQAYAKEAVEKAQTLNEKTREQSTLVLENKNNVSRLESENQRNKAALEKTTAYANQLESELSTLNKKIDQLLEDQQQTQANIPVGFGFDELSSPSRKNTGSWYNPIDYIEPDDQSSQQTGFSGLLSRPNQVKAQSQSTSNTKPKEPEKEKVIPFFTIPKDAILYDSTAFTALIGRIPVDGITPDPYPVKIFIGRENLLANGYDIPEVEGMVFSGLGVGDWNLSCVRARLYSATYIFYDGTIVNQTESEPLAEISDRTGIPCVSGRFVSNAREFITQQVALAGLGTAGAAYANAQLETTKNNNGDTSTSLIGDIKKLVLGDVVKASTDEVIDWLVARQKQSFDAVVVDPGQAVSIHINKPIMIDHREYNRRVRYATKSEHYDNTLD